MGEGVDACADAADAAADVRRCQRFMSCLADERGPLAL
jgi:hypothetical protein